ncbi:MAG: ergothioneine biosynthesis protein EgtB [Sphingomicrobium sp.]
MAARFHATRQLTLDLAAPLSDADATIQPDPDASPAKWHLAHVTWFLETFILRDLGVAPFDDRFAFLFNSYYEGEGERHARHRRGMLSRPTLDHIRDWRAHVDEAIERVMPTLSPEALTLVELGMQHEQQHQELFLTDILATFAANPLEPAYAEAPPTEPTEYAPATWTNHPGGIGMVGAGEGLFAFDCEQPRHRTLLHPHALATRPVTNSEWDQFIADGGYSTPSLWLSEGWAWVGRESISAPLYWHDDGTAFTLAGRRPRDPAAPVAHISFYEAEAFARWAGARLPREEEWEAAAIAADPREGQQLDWATATIPALKSTLFGAVWEWTGSAFLPHPGFTPATGTVGEYNGKFMSGQYVLKGASCATPRGHSRASYRNFFPPAARWQFTGVRLARDC